MKMIAQSIQIFPGLQCFSVPGWVSAWYFGAWPNQFIITYSHRWGLRQHPVSRPVRHFSMPFCIGVFTSGRYTPSLVLTVIGVATSLGLGALQVNGGLKTLFGIPNTITVQIITIVIITVLFLISSITGLDRKEKGIA
jgi:hypothetical protein